MRRLTNALIATTSCCLLLLISSCSTDTANNNSGQDAKQDSTSPTTNKTGTKPGDQPAVLPTSGDQAPIIAPIIAPIPTRPGPAVLPPSGGGGGGGGSQGSEKPARTGNPDNDPLDAPEILCDDKIDNDDDGFIDCEDTDCAQKPCNDMNGCTVDDVCVSLGVCRGSPRDCEAEVGNECTIDECLPVDMLNNTYVCKSTFKEANDDFGDCTPEGNCTELNPDGSCDPDNVIDECIVGRCVVIPPNNESLPPTFECEEANLVDLTTEDTRRGCKDNNSCTADMCKDGDCMYAELHLNPCDDGNLCTVMDTCNMGDCIGMNAPNTCTSDADCSKGSTCTSIPGTCQEEQIPFGPLAVGDPCFDDTDCDAGEDCIGAVLGPCTCDDVNSCTTPDTCFDGRCRGTIPTAPAMCTDDNPCTDDLCVAGICQSTIDNSNACTDGIGCTTLDTCVGGECSGQPDNDLCPDFSVCQMCMCTVDNGCECMVLTGPSDDECSLTLTDVDFSASLITALEALAGGPFDCNIGVTTCANGVEGACEPSALFASTCNGANLDVACGTTVFALQANADLVTQLCAELQALTTP